MVVFERRPVIVPSACPDIVYTFLYYFLLFVIIVHYYPYYPICVSRYVLHIIIPSACHISLTRFYDIFYCLLLWYYGILIYPICVPRYGLHVIMYFLSFTIMVSLCIIVPPVCPNIVNAFIFYLLLWYLCILYYVP